jgi:uncharacterized repeat protein (TIGR01451 family)
LGISLFTSLPDVHIGDTLFYSVNVFNMPFPACDAGYADPSIAGAIRAVVVTPDGVTNHIALRRTLLAPGESDFYTNVVSYVVRAQDIRSDGTVRATAADEADIHQNDVPSFGGGFQGVNTQVNQPCVQIAAQCVSGVGENGAITFTGTVTNCGNNTLVGVTVTNAYDGGFFTVLFPTNLAVGQVAPFSGSWIPLNPCVPSSAMLTVRATDEFTATPRTVTSSTTITCQNSLTPGVALTTECAPGAAVAPGQPLSYRGTVRNTGNVTLTNVVVLGDQPAANTTVFTVARLSPGQTADFTGSFTAPAACDSRAAFSVSARSLCDQPVSANSTITCPIATSPQVTVTTVCPPTPPNPGAQLTYSGTVVNGGNVTLQNVRVLSQQSPGSPVFTAASLAPGASANFTGSFGVPANACSVSDTLTVIGQDLCTGQSITNSVTTTCPTSVAARIEITKQCPPVAPAPGAPLAYSGTVRNAGNITLANVTVVSDLPAPNTIVFTAATLAPGATANFTGSFTAPSDVCSVMHTLVASGRDTCGNPQVTANVTAPCPVASNPLIAVTRDCPTAPPLAGTALAYSGTVQNTGNVTLTNIVVVSDRPAGNTVVFTAASLAPGAVARFTASYPTPVDACSVTETLTATGRDQCTGQAASDSRTTTCPLSASGQIRLTLLCPTTPGSAGGTITVSGTVSNPGDVTLNNVVVVSDSAPGTPVFTVASLAPKASANFTASLPAPANTCSAAASLTATAADRCGTGSVRDVAAVNCPVVNSPAIVVTHDCPATPPAPGESLTVAGSVRNSGNVTLNNVTVSNGSATVYGPATLEPNASANFTASLSVPADTCSVTTTLTATGADKCDGRVVSNTSTKSCPVRTAPRLLLTKSCPTTPVAGGSQITFSGTLQNAGNVTLTDMVVNRGNDRVFGPISLAPGASASFTASSSVPHDACSITESWVATGKDKCSGTTVSETATATCSVVTAPQVDLTLSCPSGQAVAGTMAKYSGTVRNPGTVSLTGIVVFNNSAPGTPVFNLATLGPGQSANFSADVSVPMDACSVSASFTVTAAGQCSGNVTDTASATCPVATNPQIAITHSCPAVPTTPGVPTSYAGRISNTGNVTLTNVVVVNSLSGNSPVFGPVALGPGQSADFTAAYTLPLGIGGCDYESRVTVSAADKCTGRGVSADHRTSCVLQQSPGLEITLICPTPLPSQGDRFHYRAIIKNVGNIRLENVAVTDSHHGSEIVWSRDSLSVGESHEMENFSTVPDDCCSITTLLRATAVDTCTRKPVEAASSGTCAIMFSPKIAVTKECPARAVLPGETASFTGKVSNPGNVTLTDVNLFSLVRGVSTKLLGPIALVPGQVVSYRASYLVPSDFCGEDAVTATGRSYCSTNVVTASASTKCPVETMPMIMVTKQCPTLPVASGDMFVFSGTVINAGDVTLTNVTVVNSKPTAGTHVFGPIALAPGESRNFTGSYKLDDPCEDTWDTLTARGVDQCTGKVVENTGTAICPVLRTPRIAVTKQGQPATAAFTGTVKNLGDVALVNVVVTSELNGSSSRLLGPIDLAPGATESFTGQSTGDALVTASGLSLCQDISVEARANNAGPVPDAPLAIDSLKLSPGQACLIWKSVPGRFYRVEYKTTTGESAWQPVPGEVRATDTVTEKIHALSNDPQRIYRVMMLE